MKAISIALATSILAVLLAAQVTSVPPHEHFPLPPPTATVNIVDDSSAGAPVKLFGTGDAYVKPTSDGQHVMLWIAENNLQFQNTSSKDITGGLYEVLLTDVRGNQFRHFWQLGWVGIGGTKKIQGKKQPDGKMYVPPGKNEIMAQADYDLGPYVDPTIKAHVLSVKFSDGTTWQDKARFDQIPEPAKQAAK
jgi:hypothetical protein